MDLKTTRFGLITVNPADIITFPDSIPGFIEKKFVLVDPDDSTTINWLQSLDDDRLAFPLIRAAQILPHYAQTLKLAENEEAFLMLTIPTNITEMTANTRAPIILKLAQEGKEGRQEMIRDRDELSFNHPIYRTLKSYIVAGAERE
jgi:flagellar assembly factor FliW